MTIRFLVFLSILWVLTGCGMTEKAVNFLKMGDKDNAEPPAELVEFRTRLNVIELWSRNTGSGTDDQYLKLAPIVANQRIFIAGTDGRLLALDATNGQRKWSITAIDTARFWSRSDKVYVTGGPGFGENSVLLGTNKGDVFAFTADRGEELWHSEVSSEILSTPSRNDNVVVVRTNDGRIYGLNGATGRRLWIYDRSVPILSLRGTSDPVIERGIVVAGFDEGRLAALDLRSGRLLWEARITTPRGSTELDRMVDIDSQPIILNGVIYVASFQGHIAAVQLETGRVLWNREISSYAGLRADDDYIYLADDASHILALDRFSGTSVWEQDKLHNRNITAPTPIGEYLVVGDLDGYLHWMTKDSGDFVARTRLGKDRIIAPPLVIGNILYAFNSDGKLAAYTFR